LNIIEVKNLSFSYKGNKVLDNISLTIKKGEITAILGDNGSGKSTLFLNLNGGLKPDEGKILFDGKEADFNVTNNDFYDSIGTVFQNPNDQLLNKTVNDNIFKSAFKAGINENEIQKLINVVATKVDCFTILDKQINELSFGQKKRVSIACALVINPKIIILDEPTAGLDSKSISSILDLLVKIKNESDISIIISTHDIDIVPLYCNHIYVLNNGKVVSKGNPQKVFNDYDTLKKYNLTIPRILDLMKTLKKEDNIEIDANASTVPKARDSIKSLFSGANSYIVKNAVALRFGYTTGSCATAVAVAGALMLITGKEQEAVQIVLPSEEKVNFMIENTKITNEYVESMVVKFAGDDPDVTDGAKIYAKVSFCDSGIKVRGGTGVGVVTQKGLQCEVGEPAINPIPLKMIKENCLNILKEFNCNKGLDIEISVENGEKIAQKTFNPRLGIIGGISILGTTGIVEPMSEKALIATIKITINKRFIENPNTILISPGNYGENFCKNVLGINSVECEKISNYIGETLDYIRYKGFKRVLFVGHIGKIIKLSGAIMNTHSSIADCRLELMALYSAMCGASNNFVNEIMLCLTTQQAIEILYEQDFYDDAMKKIMDKIMFHCNYRLRDEVEIGVLMFDNKFERIIKSDNVDKLIECIKRENK